MLGCKINSCFIVHIVVIIIPIHRSGQRLLKIGASCKFIASSSFTSLSLRDVVEVIFLGVVFQCNYCIDFSESVNAFVRKDIWMLASKTQVSRFGG